MTPKKGDASNANADASASTPLVAGGDDAGGDCSRSVWGKRDRGCLGTYNDVVSRMPSFQIFMFAIISVAVLTILYGTASTSAQKKEVMSAFVGSAAVETMLSLDNLVVFHQIFGTFKVPPSRRPGILVAGLPIMLVVRISLFLSFHGIYTYVRVLFVLIGLFIIYQGVCVAYFSDDSDDDDDDLSSNWIVTAVRACLGGRMTTKYDGSAFWFTNDKGVFQFTPLVLVMLFTEVSDLMFCIDGVSTIYVVGHSSLLAVVCGDCCAVLLVRALYPQLQGTVEIFPDLNYAVALTLIAVGVDMIMTAAGKELPVYVLVCFMVAVFLLGIISSFIRGIVSQCTPTRKTIPEPGVEV
jgi:tellurite resistance protein TerC